MSTLKTWQLGLKRDLTTFARLAAQDARLDKIYGITAAAVLWGVRRAPHEEAHLDALLTACGDAKHLEPLSRALGDWDDFTPLKAARALSAQQARCPELREALTAVLAYFIDDLVAAHMLQQDGPGDRIVSGATIVIGGRQVVAGDLLIAPLRPAAARPVFPARPISFGGRDVRFAQLADRLRTDTDTSLIALCGPDGVGKTTLARALAYDLHADQTFQAVLWADVTRAPNIMGILTGWVESYTGTTLHVTHPYHPDEVTRAAKFQLEEALRDVCGTPPAPRVLVVLDDVQEDSIGAVQMLQLVCPERSTILLTTPSEAVARQLGAAVEPLAWLTPDEAVEFLRLYLPDSARDSFRDLGEALGGHPLAMELAVHYIRTTRQLGGRDEVPVGDTRGYEAGIPADNPFVALKLEHDEPEDEPLRRALALTYQKLDAEDRRCFRALGILARGAPVDGSILAALWTIPVENVQDVADRLCRGCLIELAGDQYRQHPLLHDYARALLDDAGETDEVFDRYADAVIDAATQFLQIPLEYWCLLDRYVPHLHAVGDTLAAQYSVAPRRFHAMLLRAGAFSWNVMRYLAFRPLALYGYTDGNWRRAHLTWYTMGVDAWGKLKETGRKAVTLNNLGLAYEDLDDSDTALEYYHQALRLARRVGDALGEAAVLNNIGRLCIDSYEPRKAMRYYNQAIPLWHAGGNVSGEATALMHIGLAWCQRGEFSDAVSAFMQSRDLFRSVGDRTGEAAALNHVGRAWFVHNFDHESLPFFEKALSLYRGVGDWSGEASTLVEVGRAWEQRGDTQKALTYYDQAQQLQRVIGDRTGEANALGFKGALCFATGDFQQALVCFEAALVLHRAARDWAAEATMLSSIAGALAELDDRPKAIEYFEKALERMQAVGDCEGETVVLTHLSSNWRALGEPQKALDYLEQALPILREADNRAAEVMLLNGIGALWLDLREREKAADYFEQVLFLARTLDDHSYEAEAYFNLAMVYHALNDLVRTVLYLERCVTLAEAIGHPRLERYHTILEQFKRRQEIELDLPLKLPLDTVRQLVGNTLAVRADDSSLLDEWREQLDSYREQFVLNGAGWTPEVAFVTALQRLAEDQLAFLPQANPYYAYFQYALDALETYEKYR